MKIPEMTMDPAPMDVPIVGQAFTIVGHWPSVVLRCECDAKAILILIGAQNAVSCVACGRTYVVLDELRVRVGQLARREPALALQ